MRNIVASNRCRNFTHYVSLFQIRLLFQFTSQTPCSLSQLEINYNFTELGNNWLCVYNTINRGRMSWEVHGYKLAFIIFSLLYSIKARIQCTHSENTVIRLGFFFYSSKSKQNETKLVKSIIFMQSMSHYDIFY